VPDSAVSPARTLRPRSRKRAGDNESLDLDSLRELTRAELKERWRALYGTPPPANISRNFLRRAIAYRMQEEVYGGLSTRTRNRLARTAEDLAAGRRLSTPFKRIKPGTRLLREWHGVVHEVIVLENSVLYRDKNWPSLSAVAEEITGVHWSGPTFFGLNGKAGGRD
jgi:hypothetical protein